MKVKVMYFITIPLLLGLLLMAAACHHTTPDPSTEVTGSTHTTADTPEKDTETTPPAGAYPDTDNTEPESRPETEVSTDVPVYPGNGDIDIELPEIQETAKIILSVKNGSILGVSSLDKPMDSDTITSYADFQKLYGTAEGINESFFETHVLRLVHTAQSSGSTRYAIESVTLEDGKIKVEVIEQLAAISTRDLRYWYVFAAVEKSQVETPVEVNVTGIQLAD